MSETDLGKALLNLDADQLAGAADVRAQVRQVLAQDAARVKRWTLVTAAIWLVAVGLVLLVMIWFALIFPLFAKLNDEAAWRAEFTPQQHADMQKEATTAFMMGTLLIAVAVGVLALAALASVFLIFATRRATLRQVNASLLEISDQLKKLRQPPAPDGGR